MHRLKGPLVALAALAITAALLWAANTHFTAPVLCTTLRASSHTYTAGTDSVAALLCYGNATVTTGDLTVSAGDIVLTSGVLAMGGMQIAGAFSDTAEAEAYGDGHMLVTASGGSLLIWDHESTLYNVILIDGTVAAK